MSYVIDSSFSHQYSLSPPQFGFKNTIQTIESRQRVFPLNHMILIRVFLHPSNSEQNLRGQSFSRLELGRKAFGAQKKGFTQISIEV